MKHVIVGTAGHIDHGKTELVRALTGIDCDRLVEEKRRGITIDIGFAPMSLPDGTTLGFIDVPGHERFVKNMLAGASGIDCVVLVVSAEESIKPQTREHFDICRLLGVEGGLVALTKCDLADADLRELVALEVRELVRGSFLEEAPVLAVSARTGEGIPALRAALADLAGRARARSTTSFFRLPVDRSFSVKGFGTVVTGTLVAGDVKDGAEIEVFPRGVRARIRGIQVHGAHVGAAVAGQRTALNLQGLDAADITRGDLLAPPGFVRPSSLLDVDLTLLHSAPAPLKDLSRVRFHQGTTEILARVKLVGAGAIPPGGRAFAQLRLESPATSLPGDRFVVRRYSPMQTIGGGAVLDAHPEKLRGEACDRAEALAKLRASGPPAVALHALRGAPGGLTAEDLVVRTGLTPGAVGALMKSLIGDGSAMVLGDRAPVYLDAAGFERHRARVREVLAGHHAEHPLMMGLGREELRERALPGVAPDVARALLDRLATARDIRLEKELAALPTHEVAVAGEDEALLLLVESAFGEAGLNPPTLEEVIAARRLHAAKAQRIYHLLLSRGRLVRIRDGTVYHAEAVARLKESLWKLREERAVIDVAAFKELTGTSRKNAIPLLEHLDAERVTRRRGNDREILPPPGAATP